MFIDEKILEIMYHMKIFKAPTFFIYLIEDIYFSDLCINDFYRYHWTYLYDFYIYMIENIYCK